MNGMPASDATRSLFHGGMIPSRREFLAGGLATTLTGCTPRTARQGDVFAAGQPAAILILAVAPGRLLGWPRRPSAAALAFLPRSADRPELGALSAGGAAADLEGVAALRPELILDYGDVNPAQRAVAERVRQRLGRPYGLIDGGLRQIPSALARAGGLLQAPGRAADLAARASRILERWSASRGQGPSFYYARGGDGLETGFAHSLATEVLEGSGWTNVAVGDSDIRRTSREQVAQWDPEVLVTLDPRFAQAAAGDPAWRVRRSGGRRRLLLLPDLPFGWIDRPPSVNRLLGCLWLTGAEGTGSAGLETVSDFAAFLYGRRPTAEQARASAPRWLE
jgi:iron complex transport system substrate-binding protein